MNFDARVPRALARPSGLAPRRPALPARSVAGRRIGSAHRAGLPCAVGGVEPAVALRHRRGQRSARRHPEKFRGLQRRRRSPRRARQRAGLYARLKLAGLEEAPAHFAVFADRSTAQGHGLGRHTMPEMIEYSAVTAVHTIWLAARAQGIGMGWVSILDPAAVAAILDVPADVEIHRLFLSRLSAGRRHDPRARAGRLGSSAGCRRRSSSGVEKV